MLGRLCLAFMVIAAMALGITACGDDDAGSTNDEALANLCADLEELEGAIGDFAALDESSTLEEVEAARDEVGDSIEQVRESAADVADARVDAVESAYQDLSTAVDQLDGDDSVSEAVESLRDAADEVLLARDELFRSVDCAVTQDR
jgi:hypothetical protein